MEESSLSSAVGLLTRALTFSTNSREAVIELSGGLGGQPPSSFFNPPSLFSKITLGVRLKPPEQRSVTQCILFSACIQRFPTRVSFRMIRSSETTTVLWIIYLFTSIDVTLADVLFLYIYAIYMYTAMFNITSVLWITRDQKLKRGRVLYWVAQNKWDHLLKLYMGCLLTIKINYNGIVVSVCVFSMVKPVQCLLNMDGKGTLSISDCMFHII